MNRRSFLKCAAASGALLARRGQAALPKAKIVRVRIYQPPNLNPTFNQSDMLVAVETDAGITGYGEGGSKDLLEQCAGSLIGEDPFRVEANWQKMYMAFFYSPGREKIHALGALDLALWDIKGKALQAPVHEILGGAVRNYCECYPTGGVGGGGMSLRDRAKATIDAGYRAFRIDASGGPIVDNTFNARERIDMVAEACKETREGVGKSGDWTIDFHQRFDYAAAVECCKRIEEYEPFLVEDPVRDEQFLDDIPRLRRMTTCPLAAGEEWGQRWDFAPLVENHDIDFNRCTLPNVGGLTEMVKVMALCETHAVGIVPHFTGPVATAALVNCLATFPQQVLFEYNYGTRRIDYLPDFVDFRQGRLYVNDRPGLGVTVDVKPLKQVGEVTAAIARPIYKRPDGSPSHW
jgi:L-alanine-DL-glutamate epimerase-like enolase superfamily enzyme